MKEYKKLIGTILEKGKNKSDRTGVGTISTFGKQAEYDLKEGFPLLTLKRTPFRIIAEELIWFISGSDKIRPLLQKNVHIWDEWAFKPWTLSEQYKAEGRPELKNMGALVTESEKELYEKEKQDFCRRILEDDAFNEKYGSLNRVYGVQWRSFRGCVIEEVSEVVDGKVVIKEVPKEVVIDQLQGVIDQIKKDPNSRRLIVNAWNPAEVDGMALPPCHVLYQFYVMDGKLSCKLYQRSVDAFLGAPFNIASYALLTHMVAHICNLEVDEFIHTFGDLHLYNNQLTQVDEMMKRECKALPKLVIKRKVDRIEDFTIDDFEIVGYDPHPTIKAEVAV